MEQTLYDGCFDGKLETVKVIVNTKGINWNSKSGNPDEWTPLHAACYNGHIDVVRFLLTLNDVNVNEKNKNGETPLHFACVFGHLNIVRLLCTLKDVNVDNQNIYGRSPIYYACKNNYLDTIRHLIEVEGADYCIQDNDSITPKDVVLMKGNAMVIKYWGNITNNTNYSSSCQKDRRVQRSYERKSIALLLRQDQAFDDITRRIFKTGINIIDDMISFAKSSTTIEDIAIVCSILKMFTKMGKPTLEESHNMIEHIFGKVLHQESKFRSQDYVSVKCLLDELKNQKFVSEDNYLVWDRETLMINVETASTMNESKVDIIDNNSVYQILRRKYDEFYDNYLEFHNACKQKLEIEITLGLLRIGVNLLRLFPLMPNFSGVMYSAMEISDPVQFCRIVFEKEGLSAFLENGIGDITINPIVKYILERSKIDEKAFISELKGLIRKSSGESRENDQNRVETICDIQPLNFVLDEKDRSDELSEMDDTISEFSSTQDEGKPIIKDLAKKMKLVNLWKALKGTIRDDDFIGELMDYQYIAALHFSKGCIYKYRTTTNYISPECSINETAKLCIKRSGSEDIETEITAVQYASICGYVKILGTFFLPKERSIHIDFGLDNPVSCYAFISNRRYP